MTIMVQYLNIKDSEVVNYCRDVLCCSEHVLFEIFRRRNLINTYILCKDVKGMGFKLDQLSVRCKILNSSIEDELVKKKISRERILFMCSRIEIMRQDQGVENET